MLQFGSARPYAATTFGLLLATELLVQILQAWLPWSTVSKTEKRMEGELRKLRMEAEQLNMPATFAQSAIKQRAAAAKEKELQSLRQKTAVQWTLIRTASPWLIKTVLYGFLVWLLWSTPVVLLPPPLLSPFGSMMAFPYSSRWMGGGAVAILPWLSVSSQVIRTLSLALQKRLNANQTRRQ